MFKGYDGYLRKVVFKEDRDFQISLFALKKFESAMKLYMTFSNGDSYYAVYHSINAVSNFLQKKYNSDVNGFSLNPCKNFDEDLAIHYIASGKFETSDWSYYKTQMLLSDMYKKEYERIWGKVFVDLEE